MFLVLAVSTITSVVVGSIAVRLSFQQVQPNDAVFSRIVMTGTAYWVLLNFLADVLILVFTVGRPKPQPDKDEEKEVAGQSMTRIFGWKAILATTIGMFLGWAYFPNIEMPAFVIARASAVFVAGFAGFITPACVCFLLALIAGTRSKPMAVTMIIVAAVLFLMSAVTLYKKYTQKITGTWSVVSAIRDGRRDNSQRLARFMFKNGELTMEQTPGDNSDNVGVIQYDYRSDPRLSQIDWKFPLAGSDGLVYKGKYAMYDDYLEICVADPGNAPEIPRPEKISSDPGDKTWRYLLKRARN